MKKAPVWVFSFALFPLGLGGFLLGTRNVIQGQRSLRWPAVTATVLSSDLSPRAFPAPQPEVRFRYEFEGHAFVSDRIWPGDDIGNLPVVRKSTSNALINQFRAGVMTIAYVNPAAPYEAVLVPGPGRALRWMAVLTFFLIIGLWAPLSLRS